MSGNSTTNTKVSFHTHLKELRNRFFLIAIVFILASGVAYIFRVPLLEFLMAPLGDQKLYNITVGGQFNFIFQIMMYVGLAVTIPFAMIGLYGFIAPSLPKVAQKKTPLIFSLSVFLFLSGAAFGYYYAIPGAMRFLLNFAEDQLTAIITGESYLSFVLAYTIGVGLLFQIPLLMIIINWITPLKPRKLLGFERYVVVLAFVAAGIITPTPDAMNQVIIATPVIAMYQIGFIAVVASQRAGRKRRSGHQKHRRSVAVEKRAQPRAPVAVTTPRALAVDSPSEPRSPSVAKPSGTKVRRSINGFQVNPHRPTRLLVPTMEPRMITLPERSVQVSRHMTRSLDGISYRPSSRSSV